MNFLLLISSIIIMFNTTNYKIDFGQNTGGEDWEIVNDGVMGGLSKSSVTLTKNSLIFKGELSLKNNGGFASIRSANQNLDLSNFTSIKIKYRSSGRNFALRLATSNWYYKPNYKHHFGSSSGEWEVAILKLSDFKEYTMGEISNPIVTKDKLKNCIRIGIILSDKKEGPFEIEIDSIEFE